MDYNQAFAISATGMNLERTRVDVTALNLANAHTVAGTDGQIYQPMRVIARAVQGAALNFDDMIGRGLDNLSTFTVEPTLASPRMAYEPAHPMANDKGFVSYPGVDTATEMVTLMGAIRSYEANVAAMNAARTLAHKALDIGGQG